MIRIGARSTRPDIAGRFGTVMYRDCSSRTTDLRSRPRTPRSGSAKRPRRRPVRPTTGDPIRMPPADRAPKWLQTIRFGARPLSFNLARPPSLRRCLAAAIFAAPRRVHRHLPPGPLPLADEGQARGRAVADRRIAAAPDPRPQLGPDVGRRAPHAPAQAAAAAVPRGVGAALRADDLRRRRARDRPLADARTVRARAADAGGDARGDHERRVRDRRSAGAGDDRAPDPPDDQTAARHLGQPAVRVDRAAQLGSHRGDRDPARGWSRSSTASCSR